MASEMGSPSEPPAVAWVVTMPVGEQNVSVVIRATWKGLEIEHELISWADLKKARETVGRWSE